MIKEDKVNEFARLYEELTCISKELLLYYDIDKIKPYSVYVWSKEESDDFGENLFDIGADDIYFYNKEHEIIKDALPVIVKIQSKLKDLQKLY